MQGGPYYTPEPSRFRVIADMIGWRRLGVMALGLAAVGVVGYMQLHKRPAQMAIAAVEPPRDTKAPTLEGYAPTPGIPEVDRWKEFLAAQARLEEARQAELRALREEMAALARQKQMPQKAEKATEKPLQRSHRPMGYMSFALPEKPVEQEPLYTIDPGTKIPCIEETKVNSSVENGATVKVNVSVHDSATLQHVLIPQGAIMLQQYRSANLIYGNQRLPMYSTTLSIRGHPPIDLESAPTLEQEGQAGLVTRINNNFWRAVPVVLLIRGVLAGSRQVVTSTNPIADGVAGSVAQYGQKITQPYIDMRPTIEVDAGEGCVAIVQRPLELPAYREKRS